MTMQCIEKQKVVLPAGRMHTPCAACAPSCRPHPPQSHKLGKPPSFPALGPAPHRAFDARTMDTQRCACASTQSRAGSFKGEGLLDFRDHLHQIHHLALRHPQLKDRVLPCVYGGLLKEYQTTTHTLSHKPNHVRVHDSGMWIDEAKLFVSPKQTQHTHK